VPHAKLASDVVATALHLAYTFEDYVRFEHDAREKHEFVGGAILAMAGGTIEHGALCATVSRMLGEKLLGRRCRVYDSNARVRVGASGNAYYPDVSVVCGALATDPADTLSILNPTVVVEVLSPSTADYDSGEKLVDYQRIPSVAHVVLVHHDTRKVDVYTRGDQAFSVRSFGPGEHAALPSLDLTLSVDELYFDPLATPA
jgi:Uma2 family endonuclease